MKHQRLHRLHSRRTRYRHSSLEGGTFLRGRQGRAIRVAPGKAPSEWLPHQQINNSNKFHTPVGYIWSDKPFIFNKPHSISRSKRVKNGQKRTHLSRRAFSRASLRTSLFSGGNARSYAFRNRAAVASVPRARMPRSLPTAVKL